jgi:uncharacterized damage-inducible protein DinB
MNKQALQQYDYHIWANAKVCNHLKGLPQGVVEQEIQSVFPSIYQALVHIYKIDIVWLSTMSGDSFEVVRDKVTRLTEETQGKSVEELETLYAALAERFKAFFNEQDMDVVASYPHPQYGILRASYADIVQHIVNHGTYHRGNITAMLRQLGYKGVPTDYAFYLYTLNR